MIKPPIPDRAYLPVDGMNPDTNGMALQISECADIKNMRISRRDVRTRSGTRKWGFNFPTTDPVLHLHNYKATDGVETLFAFTQNAIYKSTTGTWSVAHASAVLETFDSLTGFSAPGGATSLAGGAYKLEGTASLKCTPLTPIGAARYLFFKGGTGIMDWNMSSYTHFTFHYYYPAGGVASSMPCYLAFCSDDAGTTPIEIIEVTLAASTTGIMFNQIRVALNTALVWTHVRSFYLLTKTATLETCSLYFDWAFGSVPATASNCGFWTTARFVDDTQGETVVAASSTLPGIDAAESDAATRVLLYYNRGTGLFATLSLYEYVSVSEESLATNGPASASIVTGGALAGAAVTGFDSVKKGTFSIYTPSRGALATASAVLSTDRYFLIPTDETLIKAGVNSWVMKDGSAWSLEFLDGSYSGMALYADYTYKKTVTYKPRYVASFHNRLLIGCTYEGGSTYYDWRVRWSSIGDMTIFNDTDYQDVVDLDITAITAMVPLGYYLIVYKAKSIVKVSYVGGATTFLFATVWKDGTYAGRTIMQYNGVHYLLGNDDVYLFDGNAMTSITLDQKTGIYRTREKIIRSFNLSQVGKCFGVLYPRHHEYWLFVPQTNETYPTGCYVYNILLNCWYYFQFSAKTCGANIRITLGTAPNVGIIDELIGTIDEQNWNFLDSYIEGSIDAAVLADAAGFVVLVDDLMSSDGGYTDTSGTWIPGAAISQHLITRDFVASEIVRRDRWTQVVLEATGTSCTVKNCADYSFDLLDFGQESTLTLDNYFKERLYFPDLLSEHMRLLIESSTSLIIRWIQAYAIVTETQNR